MNIISKELFNSPEKYIPKGPYCYEYIYDHMKRCPFWDKDETKPEQENGYCHYLGLGDWDINSEGGILYDLKTKEEICVNYFPFGLLWDQCKECDINNKDDF